MAVFRILPILEKQKVLFGKSQSAEGLKAWGDFYRSQGRIQDALDFYERAEALSDVESIRSDAVGSGNLFLYRRAMQILKRDPDPADLDRLASVATTTGHEAYARAARGEPPMAPVTAGVTEEPAKP